MKAKQNWERSDDFEMMFDGEYTTKYYKILHRKVHKEFRSIQILNEPLKRFKSLWKLPYYLSGWMWNFFRLKMSEKKERRKELISSYQLKSV